MSMIRSFWSSFRWYVTLVGSAALVVALCGCPPKPDVPPPITPADIPDGACQAAQERLEQLGCEEARTPAGEPFGEACERARARGASWCPVAVSQIDYCSQFEAAAEGRRGGC